MAVRALAGFRSLATHHCVTGSLRHIYEFHGHPISEELLLGLGAGVGFVYWHMKGTPPMYGGRANVGRPGEEGLAATAGRRTGVRVSLGRTNSAHKAEASLLEMLARGEPVMILVDMGFLPYLDLPAGYHFGGHAVVVCGYDPQGEQVLLADRDEELHPVSLAQLAQARGSTYKPFPPQNAWYTFDFASVRAPEPPEVWQAVHEVAVPMLEPPIANLGVKGIRKAAQETLKWPQIMDRAELRQACFNAFIFIDAAGGTGGGIFRYMYGRFLAEAAGITGTAHLAKVGQDLQQVGDLWQGVAEAFLAAHSAPDPATQLPAAVAPLATIAGREELIWQELRELAQAELGRAGHGRHQTTPHG